MNRIVKVLVALMMVLALVGCKTEKKDVSLELTILAAASLADVTVELSELYKKSHPNVTITYSYGASGALQTQIEEGAPADIFFSAATKQMDVLAEKGLIQIDSRKDLLVNKILLIAPIESTLELKSFGDLTTEAVTLIGLGDPASVPAGQYAEQIFTTLGTLDAIKAKANYGSDVKQVVTWVETGEVDCGIVYATDAKSTEEVQIICEAPADSHKKIIYPVAVLKDAKEKAAAKDFIEFLSSEEAKDVFVKYGFTMNE